VPRNRGILATTTLDARQSSAAANDRQRLRSPGHGDIKVFGTERVGVQDHRMVVLEPLDQQRRANELLVPDRPARVPHFPLVQVRRFKERRLCPVYVQLQDVHEVVEQIPNALDTCLLSILLVMVWSLNGHDRSQDVKPLGVATAGGLGKVNHVV
jgi:hypothetical protein